VRLTHNQWENTVRDLLRLPDRPGLSSRFTVDSLRTKFDNVAGNLAVDEPLWAAYQSAAENLARRVARDRTALGRIADLDDRADLPQRARRFVERFGMRAYRRPLTPAEIDRAVHLFTRGPMLVDASDPFAAGVEVTLETMLQSPHFLYRPELSVRREGAHVALGPFELASRLSYAVAGTMPDEPLFAAAMADKLRRPEDLAAQVERLLATDAGRAAVDDFHAQLLQLRDYDAIKKDTKDFPAFVDAIKEDMKQETLRVVRDVVQGPGSPLEGLLTAPFSYFNRRLAALYGASGDFSSTEFRKVDTKPTERLGVLTHAGFLAANSHGADPDSIHRGVFVAINVLCKPLPPPVDDIMVPELPPGLTNRERVEKVTGKGTCGEACHGEFINPPGFAFEHYDGLGQYRATDNGKPVDAADRYRIDGEPRPFRNAIEFTKLLATSREAHDCYASAWLEYLLGRERTDADAAFVRALGERSKSGSLSAKQLIAAIVTTDGFLSRAP
jgi:hypothetical protein